MSRWISQFKAHAFQLSWTNVLAALHISKVDDETVITSVEELARLKKVISYIDEMINGIDPEFVPQTTWDPFQQQAEQCANNIFLFNSNRNISHLQTANSNADNLLTYIRPYMVNVNIGNRAVRKSLEEYSKTINSYGDSFREKAVNLTTEIKQYEEQSKVLINAITEVNRSSEELHKTISNSNEHIEHLKNSIDGLFFNSETEYKKINEYYVELLIGNESKNSIKRELLDTKEIILNDKEKIDSLLTAASNQIKSLEAFHLKIFGKIIEGTEKPEGGLENELTTRMSVLSKFEKDQISKYNELNKQIETLLPGATSAGLASAYKEMGSSFVTPIRDSTYLFFTCIGILVLISFLLSIEHIEFWKSISFIKYTEWSDVLKGLLYKAPFYAPILWLAFYATKRRSENQRLLQEYAHKEALAKSYKSYKDQLAALGDEDKTMQKDFIKKMIDAITQNSSQTLDGTHGDKLPVQDVLEKFIDAAQKSKSFTEKVG
ncbi:MAG: hypothetical protein Q7T62_17955 [Undibacterium sp.]|nr:hypothetical protein [Undibacterium sp.]